MSLLEHLNLEEYTEGTSALHKLDARVKLICAITAIFIIVSLSHWYVPLLFFGVCFGLVIYSRARIKVYVDRLLIPLALIAFIGIIMPFTYGTTIIARVPLLTIPVYSQGIYFGILVFTRAISAVAVLNLLILVTPISSVMDSLAWFHVPGVLIDTMLIMFRYISILSDETERMYRAQVSRCGHSKSVGYFSRLTNIGNIAGSLLVRAFDRSIKVGNAMVSRGYTAKYSLFNKEIKKLPKLDALVGALVIAATFGVLIVDMTVLRTVHYGIFF